MQLYEKGFILRSGFDKAMLLVHGLTGGPAELRWIAGKMHREGHFDVFCPVLPGHCETVESLKKTRWQDWYKAVEAEVLRLRECYRQCYVGGLCVGGMLGLLIDIDHPGMLDGIAAWAPILFINGWNIPKSACLLPIVLRTPVRYVWFFKESHPYGVKNDFVRKMMQRMMEKSSLAYEMIPGVAIYELLKLSAFLRKRLGKVKAPVIVIHSELDDFTSIKSSKVIYEGISSEHRKFIALTDSYHMITIDNEKQIVLRETLNFFEDVGKKKARDVAHLQDRPSSNILPAVELRVNIL